VSALQAERFGSTALSTSPVGLVIEQDRACPHCGTAEMVIGSSANMHAARLTCCGCGRHCSWLSGQTHQFVSEIITHFGRPTEPTKVRHNEFVPAHEYSAVAIATPTERLKPMHIDQLYPSKFLRCADLNGQPLRVTIAGIKREDLGGESKVVLSFANGEKSLILNKTNARTIAKTLGDETRAWAGKDIVLVPAQVDFKGDIVDAIRVRGARQQKPQAASPDDEAPLDDDLSDFVP